MKIFKIIIRFLLIWSICLAIMLTLQGIGHSEGSYDFENFTTINWIWQFLAIAIFTFAAIRITIIEEGL